MEDKKQEALMSKAEEKVTIGIMIMEIFIGLLALLTIFLPAFMNDSNKFEGIYTAFGGGTYGTMVKQFFDFSFGNFLTYLLVVMAMVLVFVRLALPKVDNMITRGITAGLFLLAGILFLFCKEMAVIHINASKDIFSLGYGPILGAIACLIDVIIVGIDVWFSMKISTVIDNQEEIKPLTQEELRAQVMAEIEAEKNKEKSE